MLSLWAVPNKLIFCGLLMLIAPGIFSVCFSSPFLISPRAPITTGTVSVFIPYIIIIIITTIIMIIIIDVFNSFIYLVRQTQCHP